MAQSMQELFAQVNLDLSQHGNNKAVLNKACNTLNEILNRNPDDAQVLFTLGAVFHRLGWNGAGAAIYNYLLANGIEDAKLWNNLGNCYKAEHYDDRARECWEKAIKIKPATEYYNNLSTLSINQGNPAPGIEYAKKAIEIDPWNPQAHWNLGLLLLESGNWIDGMKEYEAGLSGGERGPKFIDGVKPWRGEPLSGKSIIVVGEQGIGDEIMFMEAMRDLHPDKLIIECHDRLETVVRRNFPNAEVYPTRKSLAKSKLHADYRVNIGSLFHYLRSTGDFNKIPYLTTDRHKVYEYKQMLMQLGPPPYIGIAYEAGHKSTHGHVRSFKLSQLKPILEQKGTFISLQYTKGAKEKFERFYKDTGIKVHHFPDVVESHKDDEYKVKAKGYDYDETFSLVAALDLCIIPCTTIAHVCGAIGKECWVLTPKKKAWRYIGADHMRMYGDHVTLYHETIWDETIQKVADSLGRRFG